jgi:hypothetical protein
MAAPNTREFDEALPKGMSAEALTEAIEHSGYPLQTVIAGLLADREYRVDEEWA